MSLRLRLTLGLVLVNAVVLGAVAYWAAERDRDAAQQQLIRRQALQLEVAELVRTRFRAEDVGNFARMLSWPLWPEFEDALILDTRVLDLEGRPLPVGVFLNPIGALHRPADFPLREITAAVVAATASGDNIPVADGIAIPVYSHTPFAAALEAWGGVYVKPSEPLAPPNILWRVFIVGLAGTAVLALLVFLIVDRAVLRPVETLARAAAEFGRGGDPPPLPRDPGSREVAALSASFAAMMQDIRGFQRDLEQRVEQATDRALQAERHASRQDRLAALGMLAAGLAHEINSPLAGALHSLEVLRREAAGARGERYGQLVEEALQRIRELVQRLLLMAPQHAVGGSCALGSVAEDLRHFLASRLQRHRLEIELEDPELIVTGARGDWFPLLLNLVQNSLDALDGAPDRAGCVRLLGRRRPNGGAELRLRDDGPGAPPALLPHLFEPFTTTKEPGRGTGLGLALAHAAVRSLGGSIEASNLAGGGFEVLILLPPPPPEQA
jgi:signal transduction histidine kinase